MLMHSVPSLLFAESVDSLKVVDSESLLSKYTVALNGVKLNAEDGEFGFRVSRTLSNKSMGLHLVLRANELLAVSGTDTTVVGAGWDDGLEAHDYTLVRSSSLVQVYRDKVLFGKLQEKVFPTTGSVTLFNTASIEDTYAVVITTGSTLEPDETEEETNLAGMLPSSCGNLITDPYCNRGFMRAGLNAGDRAFYSQQAIYTGWGPEAYIDHDAYSGKNCIRLEGQAVYPDKGASLEVALNMEANTPYYIRVMVKSDGYVGKVGIENCSGSLHITDTGGEWKQLEGVLTPTQASSLLYVNNADYENNGTLWIDNLEVYKGMKSTALIGLKTEVPYVMLAANATWAPSRVTNVYMLGFTDDGTNCSRIDTAMVQMKGGSQLKKTVKGSQWYAVHFPGDLSGMNVTGYFDGVNHIGTDLEHGVDYVLQRYDYPRFEYVAREDVVAGGSYLIQFVDNMDGTDVTMTFGARVSEQPSNKPYYAVGNASGTDEKPAGRFYKFDEAEQRFVLTSNRTVKPFEAYIVTDATVPVGSITPNGVGTGIHRVYGTDGAKVSVRSCDNGTVACTSVPTTLAIYSIKGVLVKNVTLQPGDNTISLQRGFYLAGKSKIIVK